jgi:hypothetical protein
MLLSDKSSGSTALQGELAKHPDVHLAERTRHRENETLYWNKAAAMLGLAQVNMLNSELPMERTRAKRELIKFLRDNLSAFEPPPDDGELVFEGWHKLCQRYGPVFLEKSPHHLHNWSSLELIAQCERRYPNITFRFIGLVRNPIDTLYSMWGRWRSVPERQQCEWLRAYQNLLSFRSLVGDSLRIVRYEELVSGHESIKSLCGFVGINWKPGIGQDLRASSLQRWRHDRIFGFQLSQKVLSFAQELGYKDAELTSSRSAWWPLYREITRLKYRASRLSIPVKRKVRGLLHRRA